MADHDANDEGIPVTFPHDFNYPADGGSGEVASSDAVHRPIVLLMGLRRSGKSSIQKVVFHHLSPNETLFLEATNKIEETDICNVNFIQFQIWDTPGQVDFFGPTFDPESMFGGCKSLIFVIDAQDEYMDALNKLHQTVSRASKVNQDIKFEVFIHKVDGLSDDQKLETLSDIQQRASYDLVDEGLDISLCIHLTSIYDHSIFEAFSKVVQKLIPQLNTLESLLEIFVTNSGMEKAFLFDVLSKIYVATDSASVDMQSYELCCDMIDVVLDMSCIYGSEDDQETKSFDSQSASTICLNDGTILYLKQVNKNLALVCILREESYKKQGIIEYNFLRLKESVLKVFTVKQDPKPKSDADADPQVNGAAVC